MIENWTRERVTQRVLTATLLVILFILCFRVVQFFIVPALWAAILAYVTFPVYNFFHQKVKLSPNISAGIMTVSISLMLGRTSSPRSFCTAARSSEFVQQFIV